MRLLAILTISLLIPIASVGQVSSILFKKIEFTDVFSSEYGLEYSEEVVANIADSISRQLESDTVKISRISIEAYGVFRESSFNRTCIGCKKAEVVVDLVKPKFPDVIFVSQGDDLKVHPPLTDEKNQILRSVTLWFATLVE